MSPKKVLVTGSSRGIGSSILEFFSNEEFIPIGTATSSFGVEIIKEKFSDNNIAGHAFELDLNDAESIENFFKTMKEKDLNPDILINNAGIARDNLMLRMSEQDWTEVLNVHLTGQFKLMKNFLRGMLKNKWGRIINISSAAAALGNKGQSNYVAAKAGIEAMSKTLAREVGSKNITVNCIAPGFVKTAMTEKLNEKQQEAIKLQIPAGRMGEVSDIAFAALYLASEEASYITGSTLHVNGGMAML